MKRPVKWVLGAVGAIVGLVVVATGVGAMLPRDHVATSGITLHQPPDSVWSVIRDLGGLPSWWSQVRQSVRLPDEGGRERWEQQTTMGPMPLEVTESQAPSRLVTRIAAPQDAGYGGTWTYQIAPVDVGSRVTITEDGWVANPFLRVVSRTFFGAHGTLDAYLEALGKRFGETVEPEHQNLAR